MNTQQQLNSISNAPIIKQQGANQSVRPIYQQSIQDPNQEPGAEEEKKSKRSPNDIQMIKSIKQLEQIELDLYSPRFQKACVNLGIALRDCVKKYLYRLNLNRKKENFQEKGLAEDIVELRLKHYQNRQIDLLNRILEERRKIKQGLKSAVLRADINYLSVDCRPKSISGKQQTSSYVVDIIRWTQKILINNQNNLRQSFEDQWSFENEKLSRYKSKKVFKAQMLIDIDQLKIMKERDYANKLKNIEKKTKQDQLIKESLKLKNEQKLEMAKHKNENIQRDIQEQQRRLQEKTEKDMKDKQSKHEKLEQQRIEELKRREEEFERKRQKIEQMRREQEREEKLAVKLNLQHFEIKLKDSNDKHQYQLQRVVSEARLRNTMQNEKVHKWKEDMQKQEQEEMYRLFLNEEKYRKKMAKIAKSTQDLHQKLKEKKLSKLQKQNENKQVEENEIEIKLKSIMQKFKQAEQNVEQLKVNPEIQQSIQKEKQHEIELKHELRRLKEEDRKKERDRQKRLENLKKRRILKKEKEAKSQIDMVKETEQELQRKRMAENIRSMIDLKNMFQTVQQVIQAKNLPVKEKSKILRDHSLEIKAQFIEKKKKGIDEEKQ